jgi:hypothetical protein
MDNIRAMLKKRWPVIAVVGLVLVLVFEAQYFIVTVESYYSQGELRPTYRHQEETVQLSGKTKRQMVSDTAPTIDSIQLWMTFDYINVVFKLPSGYMKDILGISDAQYPNIRLDTYSRRTHIDPEVLLKTVKQYIGTYNKTH